MNEMAVIMEMTDIRGLMMEMKSDKIMSTDDLLALRREIGADLEISTDEAERLLELNKIETKPEGWTDYFVTALSTYVVHQSVPMGYVNDAVASWLITRIDHDGVVETETELRLLLNILKVAEAPGERLEKYALAQVKEAVLNGRGQVAKGKLTPGVIGKAEVEMLRNIFYSVGSAGGVGITRMEAEEILALNKATKGQENDPEWQRFFVGALANHVMMIAAPTVPGREEALRREEWLQSGRERRRFDKGISPSAVAKAFSEFFGRRDTDPTGGFDVLNADRLTAAERVTETEAKWLVEALQSDGEIDANERALLDFIREECPSIDTHLQELIDAA